MKRFFLLAASLFFISFGYGQKKDYKKAKSLGITFFLNDFEAANTLRSQGIVDLFKDHNFFNNKNMNPGLAVNYLQGLTNYMDFSGSLGFSPLNYPNNIANPNSDDGLYMELTGQVNFKLLPDRFVVNPYVDLGVGASKFRSSYGAFIPTGVGLQFKLFENIFLYVNSQYRIGITDRVNYHFYHGIGVSGPIVETKKAEPLKEVEIPVVTDRDGDGIVDSLDRCPDTPGLPEFDGCPDKDGDGIPDIDDKCPEVAGSAKYNGCPVPDSDGDGINDEEDECPNVPGVVRYNGCPVPDSDGDGVNDEEDKCPHEVGPASNFGCPVVKEEVIEKVNKAAENIFFQFDSYKLLAKSFKSLDEVVDALNENPGYNISIDGYTDNTGNADYNLKLSDQRANSVKEYLMKKGITESRITSKGHGIDNPIADNSTSAGRAKNRRVEMTLSN